VLQYYCLSGDADALEIAEALDDKIVEDLTDPEMRKGFWGFLLGDQLDGRLLELNVVLPFLRSHGRLLSG
jgi:hypothetical protein